MTTPASIRDHPIHVMLISVPIGLWVFALVADILTLTMNDPQWRTVAFYCIGGGIAGALLAALPGLIDLVSISDPVAKGVGIKHMVINLVGVGLFAANFFMRWGAADHAGPWWLTLLGVGVISAGGWLGGELVHRHGVSVVSAGAAPRP